MVFPGQKSYKGGTKKKKLREDHVRNCAKINDSNNIIKCFTISKL